MEDYKEKYEKLQEALKELYYSAHWIPDRNVDDYKLWTAVRDAAGFEPGQTEKILGPRIIMRGCQCGGNCNCK